MEGKMEKFKIDFTSAHANYKNSKGEKVPGVTTALNLRDKPGLVYWAWQKGIDGENLHEKDSGGNIGTVTHAMIHAWFKEQQLDSSNITPEAWKLAKACFKSFDEWAKGQTFETILLEHQIVSERYQYGGTLDWYGKMNGALTINDYKTKSPGIYETDIYQLIAYAKAAIEKGYPVDRVNCICIPKSSDDSFMIQSYPVKALGLEFKCFLNLKNLWANERAIKQRKKGKKIKVKK